MCSGGLALGEIMTPGESDGLPLRDQITHPETNSGSPVGPFVEAAGSSEEASSKAGFSSSSSSATSVSDGTLGDKGSTGVGSSWCFGERGAGGEGSEGGWETDGSGGGTESTAGAGRGMLF